MDRNFSLEPALSMLCNAILLNVRHDPLQSSSLVFSLVLPARLITEIFLYSESGQYSSNLRSMFLNKWTVHLSCPGQIVEESFDSEKELVAFVNRMERESSDAERPRITVIDPEGNEKLLASIAGARDLPV
jgi:hypothetical protein